jgi:hypothetical protein
MPPAARTRLDRQAIIYVEVATEARQPEKSRRDVKFMIGRSGRVDYAREAEPPEIRQMGTDGGMPAAQTRAAT